MGEWRLVRFGDFLRRAKSPVSLREDEEYQLVTVRMHHNGVVLREKKKGKLIGSNMYRVKTGQFILSGIDARHGAFGVIPDALDGAIVTNDFWYFDIDESVVSRDFFLWLTTTPLFLDACIKSSEGTTNRRRLQGDKFYNFTFKIPGLIEQKRLIELISKIENLEKQIDETKNITRMLLQAVLREAFEGGDKNCVADLDDEADEIESPKVHVRRKPVQAVKSIERSASQPATQGNITEAILATMQPGQIYSRADLLVATGIAEADWTWAIRQLKDDGLVVQEGEKRGARYRLSK